MNNAGENSTSQNERPLLQARGVHKVYTIGKRKLEVLRGVSLSMNAGEFIALRGASGAGKSTLLHLLGGLDLPNRGEVWFADQNLKRLSNTALTRLRNTRVGFVFQAYHLLPELSALENACLPARMSRASFSETKTRAAELLKRVGLGERMEHRPYELSGGEQQRVALARALINKPDLLLADEPTGNLDSHTGDEILELIYSLRAEQNTTLVIATHSARLAARAPRVIELVDGEIKSD